MESQSPIPSFHDSQPESSTSSKDAIVASISFPNDDSSLTSWFTPALRTHPHTDRFVVIEASLTSVKYAIYHAVGYCTRHVIINRDATATIYLQTVMIAGFIGGAIFTIPYLLLLGRQEDTSPHISEVMPDLEFDWLWCLAAEMLYSAIAGGVGMLAVGVWSFDDILSGILNGLSGPLILYTSLYFLLRVVLGAIGVVVNRL